MGKVKTGLVVLTAGAIGVLTLRKLRSQKSDGSLEDEEPEQVTDAKEGINEAKEGIDEAKGDVEEAAADVEDAKQETVTAVKHAGGAVKHAGLAALKAVNSRRKDTEPIGTTVETTDATTES
ncbi:hypothetical protein [Halorhabdus amylolytica]|uniref:hypothetical protein n=1 Tax=Halorhabdus amylolytica TaxID=2559573 RepID=UPI0010AAC421|nr:hypothetical protein [Halorhabdus amylolytica]